MSTPSRPVRDRAAYLAEDTIAALSTAPGGAIGIIRVSGPHTPGLLAKLCADRLTWDALPANVAKHAPIFDSLGRPLDDTVLLKFAAPHSFTGEDLLEIQHHGNLFISERILATLFEGGARQALPGEFSFRAVRNGKFTLPQAEALADLIAASNDDAARLALEKMSGAQGRFLAEIAGALRQASASGELGIDFSDQEVDELGLDRLRASLKAPLKRLRDLVGSFERGNLLQHGIRVAFVGLPNAGKSSFFNALLGEDRSIVSHIPGTTRDVVRERLTLQANGRALLFRLEDTAGLRTTRDEIEKIGIERALRAAKQADLILLIVDAAEGETELPLSELGAASERFLGILTKCDLVGPARSRAKAVQMVKKTGVAQWVLTSALEGEGITAAAQAMVATAGKWVNRGEGELLLTRIEHRDAANLAIEHLERALQAPELDLFAADIRQALSALAPLIGETLPDDILGRVFSQFCIGK